MADPTNISRAQKLLEEMNAKYGATPPAPPVQQPVQQPAPAPKPQYGGTVNDAANAIRNRQQVIDKAAGYACGGKVKAHASGGKVKACATGAKIKTIKGPGTSTSDSIPAKVKETGEKILVSNGERILSKKQDKLLEKIAKMLGYETTDELLASGTGRPVGPTMKDGKKAAALGWNNNVEDEYTKALNPPVTAPVVPPGETPRQQKDFSGEFLGGLKNWMASKTPVASEEEAAKLRGADDPFIVGPGAVSRTMMRQAGNALVHEPLVENKRTGSAQSTPGSSLVDGAPNQAFVPNKERFPIDVQSKFITGNNGAMPDSSGGGFVSGSSAYNVNPTSQPGINRVTAQGASPLYTNINPEQAVSGLKNQTIGQPAEEAAQGLARMENANRIRGEMIANRDKDIPAGGWAPSILGGDQPAQQGMSISDIESAMKNAGTRTERAAYGQLLQTAMHGQNLLTQEGMRGDRAAGHDKVLMRGQDIAAQNELAKMQGNPLDQRKKALEVGDMEEMAKLRGQYMNAKTPEERDQAGKLLMGLSGKSERSDNFKIAETEMPDPTSPTGFRKVSYVVNNGGANERQVGAPNPKSGFTVGQTYTDANGNKAIYQKDGTWKEVK